MAEHFQEVAPKISHAFVTEIAVSFFHPPVTPHEVDPPSRLTQKFRQATDLYEISLKSRAILKLR